MILISEKILLNSGIFWSPVLEKKMVCYPSKLLSKICFWSFLIFLILISSPLLVFYPWFVGLCLFFCSADPSQSMWRSFDHTYFYSLYAILGSLIKLASSELSSFLLIVKLWNISSSNVCFHCETKFTRHVKMETDKQIIYCVKQEWGSWRQSFFLLICMHKSWAREVLGFYLLKPANAVVQQEFSKCRVNGSCLHYILFYTIYYFTQWKVQVLLQ